MRNASIHAIDLFCGAGGLTYGLRKEGINVVAGIDTDPSCAFPFKQNNPTCKFLLRDVQEISSQELRAMFPRRGFRLLAGCAPCQPFSTYTQGHARDFRNNKWPLLREFGRLVREIQPHYVTMENVPKLETHAVFEEFCKLLTFGGYSIWFSIVDCRRYGVPQTRKRLVLLASKFGEIPLLPPTHRQDRTVRNTIGNLRRINAGEVDSRDPLHRSPNLSEINLARIQASTPGGTWRDWPSDLVAMCHKKRGGQEYISVYGRMSWDEPAPTITTLCFGFGNGRFGHPEQHRAISLREAALLQTFPASYEFVRKGGKVTFSNIGRLIGNAVPVRLARIIGRTLIRHAVLIEKTRKHDTPPKIRSEKETPEGQRR